MGVVCTCLLDHVVVWLRHVTSRHVIWHVTMARTHGTPMSDKSYDLWALLCEPSNLSANSSPACQAVWVVLYFRVVWFWGLIRWSRDGNQSVRGAMGALANWARYSRSYSKYNVCSKMGPSDINTRGWSKSILL